MDLLGSAGFGLYSHDPNVLTSSVSAPLSPISLRSSSSDIVSQLELLPWRDDCASEPQPEPSNHVTARPDSESEPDPSKSPNDSRDAPIPSMTSRKNSQSPSPGEVHLLSADLACVGLSDDHVDRWALKIVKLVAFPDLIECDTNHIPATKYAVPLNLPTYYPEPGARHQSPTPSSKRPALVFIVHLDIVDKQ